VTFHEAGLQSMKGQLSIGIGVGECGRVHGHTVIILRQVPFEYERSLRPTGEVDADVEHSHEEPITLESSTPHKLQNGT
jgi:hypothetical protein